MFVVPSRNSVNSASMPMPMMKIDTSTSSRVMPLRPRYLMACPSLFPASPVFP